MKPSLGRYDVLAHIRAQIGTDNAWLTADQLCKHFKTTGDHMSKLLYGLRSDGLLMTRMRPGTAVREIMASPEGVAKVIKPTRQRHSRSEIFTPAAGPVDVKKEAVPPPAPAPAALTLADVVAKQKKARMEQIQADSVVATALETGPLSDSNGPIASEVPVETPGEVRVVPMDTLDAVCDAFDAVEALETGPLSDSNGPIASEAAPASYIDEVSTPTSPPPIDVSAEPPELADELNAVGELIERGKREPPVILYRDAKLSVLTTLAGLMPPLTAYYLREIAADLDRAGA